MSNSSSVPWLAATRDPRIVSNGRDPGRPRDPGSASAGVLGARPVMAQTFHGSDPDTVAASAICAVTPTRCQARTRLYRDGKLELPGCRQRRLSRRVSGYQ